MDDSKTLNEHIQMTMEQYGLDKLTAINLLIDRFNFVLDFCADSYDDPNLKKELEDSLKKLEEPGK
jgi:hypothetical protein